MSLESILNRILNEANAEAEKIIQDANRQAEKIIQDAKLAADALYQDIISRAKADYEHQKQRLIVNARLEYKKNLLESKQEFINEVFNKIKSTVNSDKIKKKQISSDKAREVPEDIDFYLNKTRQDYETEIAGILFG